MERRTILVASLLSPLLVLLLLAGWFNRTDDTAITGPAVPDHPAENVKPIIAGYFVNWGIYDRKHNVVDLEAEKMSHVLYAFANLDEEGNIFLSDEWADKDILFDADRTVNHQQELWRENDKDLHGNFRQLYLLKQKYRHLKVSLSVGGWSWSTHFPAVASDPQKRLRFAESAVNHVRNLGLDGIDIDWEFPKNDADATAYVELLKQVRSALDEYQQRVGQENDPGLLVSVAMPTGAEQTRVLKLRQMEPYVDIFYLMAYDLAGAWDKETGHQAPLYSNDSLNVDQAVRHFLRADIPSHKIVMGIPVYGRGYANTDGPDASFSGVPDGSWEKGSYDYKALPQPGAEEHYDPATVASWSYNAETREYVTYDSPEVAREKCNYIQSLGLGGAMFWELSADIKGDHPRSLLHTVYTSFGGQVDQTSNHVHYPESQYDTIKRS
ncbi:hypothetical protein DFQ28_008653 [Apophysomyces sp. BC1034]|nr:hypothetical protein DFQ30_001418 [Apophysomyces sp. BC1015]KAG0180925.1 hypothetical protein DFQ29_009864 [Apophysomyces sp. BC1021]KAG0185861.1 hypothetical protein DFQ28_008653 [Apophysomyces sp. BC1034]